MFPNNEAETIELYKLVQRQLGWQIISLQTAFPDAVIENGNGTQLVIEFEYLSKNFDKHKHDSDGCDLIVCWTDNWENPPVPIWALEDCAKEEAKIVTELLTSQVPRDALIHANDMIEQLEARLDILQPDIAAWTEEELEMWLGEDDYCNTMYVLAEREIERRHGLEKGALDKPPFSGVGKFNFHFMRKPFRVAVLPLILYILWETLKWFLLDAKGFWAALVK